MSVNRLVALFWLGATLCIGIFFERLFSDLIFSAFHLGNPILFFDWSLSTVLGFGLAVIAAVVTWFQPRLKELAFESASEVKKVTWPNRLETQRQTVAVLATTVICAGILGLFDAVGARVMTGWLPRLIAAVAQLGH